MPISRKKPNTNKQIPLFITWARYQVREWGRIAAHCLESHLDSCFGRAGLSRPRVLTGGRGPHSSLGGGRRTGTLVRLTHTHDTPPFSLGLSPSAVQSAVTSLLRRGHRCCAIRPITESRTRTPCIRIPTPPNFPLALRLSLPTHAISRLNAHSPPEPQSNLQPTTTETGANPRKLSWRRHFFPSSPDSSARCHFFLSRAPFHHFANHHFRCCRGFN